MLKPTWSSILAVASPPHAPERWLSGRKRRFAKPVSGVNLLHGFESRPLRFARAISSKCCAELTTKDTKSTKIR